MNQNTQSLREEIDELLYREMFEPYGLSQTNFIRNGVLRILEKRIDSVLEEQSKYHEDYAEGLHRLQRMLK